MDKISMAASPSSSALLRCRTCRMAPLRQYQVCPVDAILTENDGKTVADMIYELTEILVTIDRNLPQFVCLSCVEDLRSAYGFRQRCLEANEAFLAELDEDGLATPGETSVDAADPSMLVLKMEPCDAELMDPEENEELLEALADDGNRTTVSRKKRKSFTFNQIAVHYIVEQDDGRHHCAIDEQSGCGYSQGVLELGNFIRHFRMKHKWEAERKGFIPGVPPKEIPQAIEASKDAVSPTNSPKRTKKSPATSMSKFIKRSGNTYRCAIDEQRVCSYSRNRRDMSCFFRHFRTAHPKAAVANNLCNQPKRKARTVRIPPPEKVETESKKELSDERQKSNNSNETNYCKIAIQYVKSVNGKFQCAIDESSDCRYAQRSNYDAGNFIRHFRKLHPLEAFEKNLVRSDMHSAMIAEEQKRIARKHTVSIVPTEVLEACIQLMAVHNLPVQCFGWAGMQTLLDRLTTTLEFKINDHCMVEHIQKSAERMIWIAQQEMRGKLISIHVESMAHGKIHYLIVSAHFTNTRRLVTRTLGQIRVTEALPARDAKARFLELLGRYQLLTKQIVVVVLGNIGSVPGIPEKLQSLFADSLIKPNFKFGAPNKEEALMDSLAEELRGQFEVVRNVVSVILTTLNEMFSDTDPAFVRIDRYLQDLRSPQYEGFFLEHNAPYPPTWHSQWISKFQSVRCIVEQEQLLMKLAQKHPELALEEPDWQLLREFHQALLPLHAFIERLERTSDEHVPFSSFYLECLSVVKTVRRGMASNRFSKPVSDALGKRLLALRERKVFQAALYLDPRFQHYQSAVLSPDQQAGGQGNFGRSQYAYIEDGTVRFGTDGRSERG
ncbi:uncharacterized protein LOC110676020 isoform X6 [Aedes aegypti]|uniref:Uncharacterized protein n=1 Tax=Aedes aegypti TaxID=7159 RepID=A0A6I8U423_AEDAE|nr:uncharacterized protein LOC110676020 isoform X6 [Aedes aegypti]